MDTTRMTTEDVSALADGELSDTQVDELLAKLRDPGVRADWDLYHQIGDILRSPESAAPLSAGFADRLAKRLEAEPAIVAPILQAAPAASRHQRGALTRLSSLRRFAMPGMVAAAAAAAAFVGAPHLLVAMGSQDRGAVVASSTQPMIASASHTVSHASVIATSATAAIAPASEGTSQADGNSSMTLRDAGMDEYLIAHQRFSPSLYSTAQFARSAAFANESGK